MAPLLEVHLPGCVFALGQLTGRLQTKKERKREEYKLTGGDGGKLLALAV